MKNNARFVLGLVLCLLIIAVTGCPSGGGDGENYPDVETSLASGHGSLKNGDYDDAIAHYRAAYNADKNNPEAITYSVLAELAALSIDPQVRELITNRFGIVGYPETMGALFTNDWMKEYPDRDGVNSSQSYPELTLPEWFKSTSVYTDTLAGSGVNAVQSTATYPLLLAANLLDRNTEGLNGLFDEILDSVFGSKFDDLAGRVKRLRPEAAVTVDADVIAALGLDGLLEGDSLSIGKPELDVLIAGIRILKATFELIASYDWNADFSFAKFDWAKDDAFAAAMAKADANQLPFRNDFLNSQDPAMLKKSKEDYLAALSAISDVYDSIGNRDYIPQAAKGELDNYRWIQDGVNKLHDAIEGGGKFWVPQDMPQGQNWTGTEANAIFGIDAGKLFALNHLKLNDLVETSGKNPVFYGFNEVSDSWVKINSLADITPAYEALGFKIRLDKIKALIPRGFDDSDSEITVPMFPGEIGKEIYKKYYP